MDNDTTLTLLLRRLLSDLHLRLQDIRELILHYLTVISGVSCLLVTVLLVIDSGFQLHEDTTQLFISFHSYLLFYFLMDWIIRLLFEKRRIRYMLTHPTDFLTLYPLSSLLSLPFIEPSFLLGQLALLLIMFGRLPHMNYFLNQLKLKPTQMFLFAFLFTVFLGSILLSLPLAISAENIHYIDALFTAFSSVCVTGLSVIDIGTSFSYFGHIIILILIQIGGLGIMAFSVLFGSIMRQKFSSVARSEFQDSYNTYNLSETIDAIKFIFKLTFIVELIGAISLFSIWHSDFASYQEAAFYSIFHSISAFCNSGFSLFSTNVVSYQTHLGIISSLSLLIFIGGLGFPVLYNLTQYIRLRNKGGYLKLHTKLALSVTFLLLIIGTIFIYFSEASTGLSSFSQGEKVMIAFFQSISARTAGFNSIDISTFRMPTLVFMMILMMIGASPGSTGGGLKTTTFGVMMLSFWHTLKLSRKVVIYGRTIEWDSIHKTFAILMLALSILFVFLITLLWIEPFSFMEILFETVSALGTVGFSLGITAKLSSSGKGLIMLLMFIGRLGALTIAYALSKQKSTSNYQYPKERIIIT
jgi:trk system potassium uptake protein TrkH